MDRMAQLRLRDDVRFQNVTVDEARSILDKTVSSAKEESILSD
jgi:allophanate hydrolase subunit 2